MSLVNMEKLLKKLEVNSQVAQSVDVKRMC